MLEDLFADISAGRPDRTVLIVLGSGMSSCFTEDEVVFRGEWKGRGVDGHPGRIALWEYAGMRAILLMGRRHLYEGYRPEQIAEAVCAAGNSGVRKLILTSAAGGLNPLRRKGQLILHSGYLTALFGKQRLSDKVTDGQNGVRQEVHLRNTPSVSLYPDLIERAGERHVVLGEGIYAGVLGPSYETRAEIRALRRMGADLVGMSVLTEIEAATAYGMQVVALSLVTNTSCEIPDQQLSHEEVTDASASAAVRVRVVLEAAMESFSSAVPE